MGERPATWAPSCNGPVRIELSGDPSDSGALLLREVLDNSGVIAALEDHLVDRRDPQRASLAGQPTSSLGVAMRHGVDRSQRYHHAAA